MATNETSTFDFYYFIGGEDVNATPTPQQETFKTFTQAVEFVTDWKQERKASGRDDTYKVEYVHGTAGIVTLLHSDKCKQHVPDHIVAELLFWEGVNPDRCASFLSDLYRWHGIPAKQPRPITTD